MPATLDRRRFLTTSGALALAGAAGAATSQIIDTHIHFFDTNRPGGVPWPPKTDSLLYRPTLPGEYISLVRPLGVTGAIVVEASSWLEDNQWVLDLAKENSFLVGLVGRLEADGFAANLERFRKNPLFLGIRLGGAAIGKNMDNLRRLSDAGLTLDAIGNSSMIAALLRVTDQIPKLRIAIDHMPAEPVGWAASPEARASLLELAKRPNVFAKVSGVVQKPSRDYRPALDEIWEMFGPDRVMYGSNWPVSNRIAPYADVIGVVREYVTRKGAVEAEKYFAGNARACYNSTRILV